MLMVARGTPMLLMGDEMGRTQWGNNNVYCHDNDLNWLDWSLLERESELFHFTRLAIALRRRHPALRSSRHPRSDIAGALGFPEISWHGSHPWSPDWSPQSHLVAVVFASMTSSGEDVLYYAWNSASTVNMLELPVLPEPFHWRVAVNTGCEAPLDINNDDDAPELEPGASFLIGPYSSIVLFARRH